MNKIFFKIARRMEDLLLRLFVKKVIEDTNMKFIKYTLLLFLLLFPNKVLGAENQKMLDLTVNPQKVLFDVRNLKPGDSIERVLVVGNNGKGSFYYRTLSGMTGGSEKLYDSLYLKVSNNQGRNFI